MVFIGDSITQGSKVLGQTPPDYAGEYLISPKNTGGVQVANCGVSGRTTVNFLPATNTEFKKVKAAADKFYVDKQAVLLFSVMLGTNDSAIKGPLGAPVAPGDYRANLKTIADSLLAAYPGCKIVFNYPIWYSNNTHNRGATYLQEGQDRVKAYWIEIDELVQSYKSTKHNQVFKGDKNAYAYFEKNYLTDFKPETGPDGTFYLHPNAKGDKALGEFWAKAILKAVK
ncbi:SGNH/GDSL hydrolase family protein [Mucilaginibacter terrae]|uniref:SGNH/GDSL hydrolase family protein n=1 Tax=Mucilaginibacter terrae TaxID=1955052 RepID=UPI00366AD377